MVPKCYVDGDIADWQSEGETRVGCDIQAVVIYHPEMSRREFERSCDWLEDRAQERLHIVLSLAKKQHPRFGVIDSGLQDTADEIVSEEYGDNFLETFIGDSNDVAIENLAPVFSHSKHVDIFPSCASDAISVTPAKSFRSEKALAAYLSDGRTQWKPAVRLTLKVTIEGEWSEIEAASSAMRLALTNCGPIAEWRQSTRLPKEDVATMKRGLMLVANNS